MSARSHRHCTRSKRESWASRKCHSLYITYRLAVSKDPGGRVGRTYFISESTTSLTSVGGLIVTFEAEESTFPSSLMTVGENETASGKLRK